MISEVMADFDLASQPLFWHSYRLYALIFTNVPRSPPAPSPRTVPIRAIDQRGAERCPLIIIQEINHGLLL